MVESLADVVALPYFVTAMREQSLAADMLFFSRV